MLWYRQRREVTESSLQASSLKKLKRILAYYFSNKYSYYLQKVLISLMSLYKLKNTKISTKLVGW